MCRRRSSTGSRSWRGRSGSNRLWPGRSCGPAITPTKWCLDMRTSILLPEIGVAPECRVTLSAWYAMPGDLIFEGDRIVEVLTEGATFDVSAPASGCLVE